MIVSFAILILGLLGAAFFAGTETAFIKLISYSEDKDQFTEDIRRWLRRPQTIFSVSLIGTNICQILATSIATKISVTLFPIRGELYSLLVMTLSIMIFCEVIPKSRALAGPESFAKFASKPFGIFAIVIKPLSYLTDNLSTSFVRYSHKLIPPSPTPDWKEFELVAKEGELKLGINRNSLLSMVFDLEKKTAFDVMTPIGDFPRIMAENIDKVDFGKKARETERRFVIAENAGGEIEGVADIAKIVSREVDAPRPALSEPFYVPETTSIIRLFAEMRDSGAEFALVVDEHGTVTGGIRKDDIADIFSGVKPRIRGIRGRTVDGYIIEGAMNIGDLESLLGIEFPDGPYRTAGGFIEEYLQDIPETSSVVFWGGYKLIVLKRTPKKITRIRVEPIEDGK